MFKRTLREKLASYAHQFSSLFLTGPRQSGKTTLLKRTFPDHTYLSLENPNTLSTVQYDPLGFFGDLSKKWIIDEAQEYPALFSFLQGLIDENPIPGRFILSGSQNFLLNDKITQSLAGRVGILELLPLTYTEYLTGKPPPKTIWDYLLKGHYPGPLSNDIPFSDWFASYIKTYIERDVRSLLTVQNLSKFQTFLKLCAGRHGQILNLSQLSVDAGISQTTATEWLSILEASYICFRLHPYYKNFSKRLIKTPKLYFYDSGIVCFLLGIETADFLSTHVQRGAIFEGFILSEIIKKSLNIGKSPHLYFWRDHQGLEVDAIQEKGDGFSSFEIKSSQTFDPSFLDSLKKFLTVSASQGDKKLIYCGEESFKVQNFDIVSWKTFCQSPL